MLSSEDGRMFVCVKASSISHRLQSYLETEGFQVMYVPNKPNLIVICSPIAYLMEHPDTHRFSTENPDKDVTLIRPVTILFYVALGL